MGLGEFSIGHFVKGQLVHGANCSQGDCLLDEIFPSRNIHKARDSSHSEKRQKIPGRKPETWKCEIIPKLSKELLEFPYHFGNIS
jgi:hypothetical protein